MRHFLRRAASAAGVLFALTLPALAHPHIFIDARAKLIFDQNGDLAEIHNSWTFDEAFSVWQIQGLDTNGDGITSSEEMQELADENMKGLADYGFYTSAGEGEKSLDFDAVGDQKFVFKDNHSTLDFTIRLKTPYRVTKPIDIAIADPEYYVAITFKAPSDVELVHAPKECQFTMVPPREMSDDLAARLFAIPAEVTHLPADLEAAIRGVQGAIRLNCAGIGAEPPKAANALEAVTQVAQAKPSLPFGGPPPEPGFMLPDTGVLGMIKRAQADFYQDLTAALGRLKSDWTAFWVLGLLSFLYGVFHSAGPGHGKVVIGTYMLASEQQLKRGIGLSFAAAMVQSLVAIVFVGIAAAVLGLSANVMNGAVGWLETASYGLITLLGLWLILRLVFGWGHHHHHHDHKPKPVSYELADKAHRHLHDGDDHVLKADPTAFRFKAPNRSAAPGRDAYGRLPGDPHFGHDHGPDDHDHDHDHDDHRHIVRPEETGGDWRAQLGVVLGVGIRPCSGALVVLTFALSQGVFLAGIAAVLLMGLGTAITVALLASLAVGAKGLARRFTIMENRWVGRMVWVAELLGGVIVLLFGLVFFLASLP